MIDQVSISLLGKLSCEDTGRNRVGLLVSWFCLMLSFHFQGRKQIYAGKEWDGAGIVGWG